jgi:UDP-N-acetylglucosamine acyltransferase
MLTHIHPNAKIGPNVTVEPFSVIYDNVEIGEGTWIGPNVTIMPGSRIGKHCKIFPGAVIGAVPQDLKFDGEETLAIVGDHTVVRECVTINRGTSDRMQTVVGAHCLLMAYVHVAHDCIVGNHCILANAVQVAGHVVIGDHAILGGNSGVHQFVHIGVHAMIAGGSSVLKDVPPYSKAGRDPLRFFGLNLIGLRRRGFTPASIDNMKAAYQYLYFKGLPFSVAIKEAEEALPPSPERDEILDFAKNSKRGLIRAGREGGED